MVNNTFIYDDNFLSEKEIQEVEDLFKDNINNWMRDFNAIMIIWKT